MKNLFLLFLLSFLVASCSTSQKEITKEKHDFNVVRDLEWASPDGHSLTMNIFTPDTGKDSYPVLIVYHGGGWLINTNEVMDSLSMYISQHSEIVVANVNYRLLEDRGNTIKMNEIVEDALGAFLWVKNNITEYGGDPSQIAVTGDSAGGHLAMMVMLGRNMIGDGNWGPDDFTFLPTWMPSDKSIDEVRAGDLSIITAIPSYGAFDMLRYCQAGFEDELKRGIFGDSINFNDHPEYYKAVSPNYLIPDSKEESLPKILLTVGSWDRVTTPQSIMNFKEVWDGAGHESEYWVYQDMRHAYLDGKMNDFNGMVTAFHKDAPYAIDVMIDFLESAFAK